MNTQIAIEHLTQWAATVDAYVRHVPSVQARWKPSPADWSILEVINHLYDEERRDFRVRIDYTLNRPDEPWPAIDPARWVTDERYNDRELASSLANFRTERDASLEWLSALGDVDWNVTKVAPWGGTMRAGDLLSAWVAHDLLHLRQLNELHYLYWQESAFPYSPDYAGEW